MFLGIEIRFEDEEPQRFPHTQAIISFGRAEHVDFRLADELAEDGVGREHFELERIAGSYRLRLNNENAVFVDRKRAINDDEIPGKATLSLAAKDGPAITIKVIKAGGVETVDRDGRNQSWQQIITSRVAVAIAAVVLIGALSIYHFTRPPFPQSLIDQMKASTYPLIEACDDGSILKSGTAWVAAVGVLATNIHVTRHLDRPTCGGILYLRLMDCGGAECAIRDLKVLRADRHPAYEERRAFTDAYAKYDAEAPTIIEQRVSYLKGFDVALIYVSDPGLLGPPLPIASQEHLTELSSGAELALVGFPVEGLQSTGGGYNLEKPVASFQSGILSRMMDYFLQPVPLKDDNEIAGLLIEYDIETTGGNSGSPVFDRHGHVVAIHFSGSRTPVPELGIRLGGLTGFGLRGDAILELVEGTAEARLADHRAYWNAQMDLEAKAIGKIDANILESGDLRLVQEITAEWVNEADGNGTLVIDMTISESGSHVIFFRSQNALDSASLRSVKHNGRSVFPVRCERGDFYAACNYQFEAAGDYSVQLRGPESSGLFDIHIFRY